MQLEKDLRKKFIKKRLKEELLKIAPKILKFAQPDGLN